MNRWDTAAYSRRDWIKAVNLIALISAGLVLLLQASASLAAAIEILPYTLVVTFFLSWAVVAWPLRLAMKTPASYLRAVAWGAGVAALLGLMGIVLFRVLMPGSGQVGAGEFLQSHDGVLTPYGWGQVLKRNLVFVGFGCVVAVIVRALVGPGEVRS